MVVGVACGDEVAWGLDVVDGALATTGVAVCLGAVAEDLGDFFGIGHVDGVHGVMGRIGGFWREEGREEGCRGGQGAEKRWDWGKKR